MTSITIDLQDDVAERLQTEARRRNTSAEALAEVGIREFLKQPDEETRRLIDEIIEDNRELYQRLA